MEAKVECERILVLCHGCLSADRKISCVTGPRKRLFTKLRGDRKHESHQTDLLLCWECIALINKMKQFQTRIKGAQKLLLDYLNGCTHDKNKFKPYTQLSQHKNVEYDFNYIYEDTDQKVFYPIPQAEKELETSEELFVEKDNFVESNVELLHDIKSEIKDEIDSVEMNNEIDYTNESDVEFYIQNRGCKKERDQATVKKKKKKIRATQSIKPYAEFATCIIIHENFTKQLTEFYENVHVDFSDIQESKWQSSKDKFACKTCQVGFKKHLDYTRHNVFRHSEFTYPTSCKICKEVIVSDSHLHEHWKLTHNLMTKCKFCGLVRRTVGEIRKHLNRFHTRIYKCERCPEELPTLRAFSKHYNNVHEVFQCDYCKKNFKVKKCLEGHIKKFHLPGYCSICKKSFKTFHKYFCHAKLYHPNTLAVAQTKTNLPSQELRYCVECDKQFNSVELYKKHIRDSVKHTPKPKLSIPCPACDKTFSKVAYRNNHYNLVHMHRTKHYCDLCDKYFANAFGKRTHFKRIHQKIPQPKDKICDLCGRGFSSNRILINHRRTHTGERPYKCAYCPATFAQKTAMVTHQRTQHKNVS